MNKRAEPPNLEERFLEPQGWRWHSFKRNERTIRFGSVFPKDSIPDAVVVCLQGVREFSEKYFEVARWCNDHNLAFWMCDWVGQGKSQRYLPNTQKRHNHSFDDDVKDLQAFVLDYIKHSSVHPDKGRIPLAMLAHSMGANIGLHHLQQYPGTFECAALTAPMIGIKAFEKVPSILSTLATSVVSLCAGTRYIPGGGDWKKGQEHIILSSDQTRHILQDTWFEHDSDLRCGAVTFGWVHEANKSCLKIQNPSVHKKINTPCLFGMPAHEKLVDNKVAKKTISGIDGAKVVDYPDAYHEILMENDTIRDNFLEHFYALIKETIIDRPETLKPF